MGNAAFYFLCGFFIGGLCVLAVAVNQGANQSAKAKRTVAFIRSGHKGFAQEASKRGTGFTSAGGSVGCCIGVGVGAVCTSQWGERTNMGRRRDAEGGDWSGRGGALYQLGGCLGTDTRGWGSTRRQGRCGRCILCKGARRCTGRDVRGNTCSPLMDAVGIGGGWRLRRQMGGQCWLGKGKTLW